MSLTTFTMLYNMPLSSSQTFPSLQIETPYQSAVSLNSPSPQPLATTSLCSVSVDLSVLDISYNWNHTLHAFCLCLLYLRCSMNQCLTPFYGRILFHCMAVTHFVQWLIHWWTFGLPVVNKAEMNIRVRVLLWVLVFTSFGYILRSEIAGSYA